MTFRARFIGRLALAHEETPLSRRKSALLPTVDIFPVHARHWSPHPDRPRNRYLYATLAVRFVDASPFLVGLIAVSALLAAVRFALTLLDLRVCLEVPIAGASARPARTLRMIVAGGAHSLPTSSSCRRSRKLWMGPDRLRPSAARPRSC